MSRPLDDRISELCSCLNDINDLPFGDGSSKSITLGTLKASTHEEVDAAQAALIDKLRTMLVRVECI